MIESEKDVTEKTDGEGKTMDRYPGLTVSPAERRPDAAAGLLDTLFLSGGLYLSQVVNLTGLASHEVQNWVRRGFLTPPVHKTYSRNQFCRIVLIHHLRQSLRIETIARLLEHINGHLDDESDDLIDDAALYNYYVNTLFRLDGPLPGEEELRKLILDVVSSYVETVEGSRQRLVDVLTVMVYAGTASSLRDACDSTIASWQDGPSDSPEEA